MKWDFFDKIYVINLTKRVDRKNQVTAEMKKHSIPFEIWTAKEGGSSGLHQTLNELFDHCLTNAHANVLVFEDDVHFVVDDPLKSLAECIRQLPKNYFQLYLGVNHPRPFKKFYAPNLLKVENGLSLHAVLYSYQGMKEMLQLPVGPPPDVTVGKYLHPQGKSFCTYPLLATQRPSHSDIEKRFIDWSFALQDRFYKNTEHLVPKKNLAG